MKIRIKELNVFYAEPDDRPVQLVVLVHSDGTAILYVVTTNEPDGLEKQIAPFLEDGYEVRDVRKLIDILGELGTVAEAMLVVEQVFDNGDKEN